MARRFRMGLVLGAMVVVLFAVVGILMPRDDGPDGRIPGMFGGDAGIKMLQEPDRVEIYRIAPLQAIGEPYREGPPSDYPVLAGPYVLPEDTVDQLRGLLTKQSSYGWDYVKACTPTPGVRVDFVRANQRLQVMLCFQCEILTIYRDDVAVGGGNFDPIYPNLVQIVKAAFPDDPLVQKLPTFSGSGTYHGL